MIEKNKVNGFRKPRGCWTLERCKKDALNYEFKFEWQKSSSAYMHIGTNDLMNAVSI